MQRELIHSCIVHMLQKCGRPTMTRSLPATVFGYRRTGWLFLWWRRQNWWPGGVPKVAASLCWFCCCLSPEVGRGPQLLEVLLVKERGWRCRRIDCWCPSGGAAEGDGSHLLLVFKGNRGCCCCVCDRGMVSGGVKGGSRMVIGGRGGLWLSLFFLFSIGYLFCF